MLFESAGAGNFHRAAEADSWRGLAAIAGDPSYETARAEERLVQHLRLAHDAALILELEEVEIADHDGVDLINVASDETLMQSLHRLGVVPLEPGLTGGR